MLGPTSHPPLTTEFSGRKKLVLNTGSSLIPICGCRARCEKTCRINASKQERSLIMTTRILLATLVATTMLAITVESAQACQSCCGYKSTDYTVTCGPGLACEYTNSVATCTSGGCYDCQWTCGTGECTCPPDGSQTYTVDCIVNCTAFKINKSQYLYADFALTELAVPDCKGQYRLTWVPLRRMAPGQHSGE